MSRGDDPEIFEDPPPSIVRPVEVHNHFSQSKNGNGASVNKLVWGCAVVLAVMILGIQSYVGAKVWEMSERLARVEATLQARPNQPGP